jgi:hypothetical protein
MKTLNMLAGTLVLSILFYSCDKNEFAPEVADQEFTIAENSPYGTILGAVSASDADEGQLVSFEIIDGNINGTFEIDASSGVLSVSNPVKLDYEENTQITITVSVADSHDKDPRESSARIQINLTDVNEFAPVVNDQVFELGENAAGGTEIGSVLASDSDTHQELIYDILPLSDNGYVSIEANTGNLTIIDSSAFDFELREQIVVSVRVRDNHSNSMSDTAMITINILDVPELGFGLAGYYPFNGNANDESGNGLHGTVQGATLINDRFGNANAAYEFDGSATFISLPDEFDFQNKTISLWINASAATYGTAYGSIYQSDNPSINYGVVGMAVFDTDNAGTKELLMGISGASYSSNITIDTWFHVIMLVNSSKEVQFYLDGVLAYDGAFPNYIQSVNGLEQTILGSARHTLNSFYKGAIDDVRIYNRILSEEEISLIHQAQE